MKHKTQKLLQFCKLFEKCLVFIAVLLPVNMWQSFDPIVPNIISSVRHMRAKRSPHCQ